MRSYNVAVRFITGPDWAVLRLCGWRNFQQWVFKREWEREYERERERERERKKERKTERKKERKLERKKERLKKIETEKDTAMGPCSAIASAAEVWKYLLRGFWGGMGFAWPRTSPLPWPPGSAWEPPWTANKHGTAIITTPSKGREVPCKVYKG